MGDCSLGMREKWGQSVMFTVMLLLGLGFRGPLWGHGRLLPVFRALYYVTLCCVILGFGLRRTRQTRSVLWWHVAAVLLLLARAFSPWLDPLPLLHAGFAAERLFAYDGGCGALAWSVLHAAGFLAASRLYALRCRGRSVLLAVTWTLAAITLVSNGHSGGDELFARWRT